MIENFVLSAMVKVIGTSLQASGNLVLRGLVEVTAQSNFWVLLTKLCIRIAEYIFWVSQIELGDRKFVLSVKVR